MDRVITRKKGQKWTTTAVEIDAAMREIEAAVNHGCSARRAYFRTTEDTLEKIRESGEGYWYTDGGGVPNSYRYRAETSVVGIAWWTDGVGRTTIRVTGARTTARSGSYGNTTAINPFGYARPWAMVFPQRAAALETNIARRITRLIAKRGKQGADDRLQIRRPEYSALAREGFLIADSARRPALATVVVTDATTGQRHHISVPPRFADPSSKTYQRLTAWLGERGRVIGALAWSFGVAPEKYLQIAQEA